MQVRKEPYTVVLVVLIIITAPTASSPPKWSLFSSNSAYASCKALLSGLLRPLSAKTKLPHLRPIMRTSPLRSNFTTTSRIGYVVRTTLALTFNREIFAMFISCICAYHKIDHSHEHAMHFLGRCVLVGNTKSLDLSIWTLNVLHKKRILYRWLLHCSINIDQTYYQQDLGCRSDSQA